MLTVNPFVSQIVMPPHLEKVRDRLAENIHELWAINKIELGWSYGKVQLTTTTKNNHSEGLIACNTTFLHTTIH